MSIRSDNEARSAGRLPVIAAVLAIGLGLLGVACGGPKQIHHYQPDVIPDQIRADGSQTSDLVLAIEDFSAGAAYDEQRIVYRSTEYRFDYYHYHRWAAPPGMIVSDTLREVYRQTGAFRSVVGGYDSRADLILAGRVVKFEEVDHEDGWLGRVVVDLRLRDSRTGELLWNDTITRESPLPEQTPQGLANALSQGLTEIGVSTTEAILEAARQRSSQPKRSGDSGKSNGILSSPSDKSDKKQKGGEADK